MAIRNIREIGEEVLTKVCKEVKEMTPRTRELIEDMLDTVVVSSQQQLDSLFADEALDIETDIEVLETMIQADGHTDQGMTLGGH